MKKLFFISFIICAIVLNCNFANAEIKKDAGYISLNASKTQELEPNKAQVSFAVETTASEAQKAAADNNLVSNKIINALKAVTSTQTDTIKTNNFSVRPNYVYAKDGTRSVKNYTAVNSVTVDTKDIQKISKFIDTAIANGANRTDNLSYSYENSEAVCQSLYPQIMKDLRNQAAALATASGSVLDGVKFINASCNTDISVSNGRFYAAKAMDSNAFAEGASATPVESGKVKIRVYVNADYYVK